MFTNHTEYNAYFRDLARRHVDIRHTEQEWHFARITLSADPYLSARAQIDEFINGIRSQLHTPFMLLVSYDADYSDNQGDFNKKGFNGAFVILDLPKKGDANSEEAIYDKTERIGEEILGLIIHELEEDPELGFLPKESMSAEKMAKIKGDYYGTRFTFSILQSADELLEFKPDKFID